MTKRNSLFAILAACLTAVPLSAQIGSAPDKSPYRDLEERQRFGVIAGTIIPGTDPAGVAPVAGPLLGIRYDLHLGAAAYLNTTFWSMSTSRPILDYTKTAATRNVGSRNVALTGGSADFAVALTGQRSWHNLQPLVNGGVGFVSAFGDIKGDQSAYRFESKLTLNYGFGIRRFLNNSSELRLDVGWYMWQFKYPDTYLSTAADPTPISPNGKLTGWTFNKMITLSYAHAIFR